MKPIGLVFVIINLVLAAAFLGWSAFAIREADSASAQISELQANLEAREAELNADLSTVRTSFNNVKDEFDLSVQDLGNKDAVIADQKSQIAELSRTNDELTARVAGIDSKLGDLDDAVTQSNERAERAEEARREAEQARDAATDAEVAAVQAQKDAEDALGVAENMIADLEVERTTLGTELGQATTLLAIARDQGYNVDSAQPLVSGRIVTVKDDVSPALVALNVGSADQVSTGMTFEVFSGNEYKGQVRIETVKENISSAILLTSPPGASPLRQGDQVATRL